MKPEQIVPIKQEEKKSTFNDFIKLDQELKVQEAVDVLTKFHDNSTQQDVLDAFPNLKSAYENHENAKVVFSQAAGVQGVLSMKISNESGIHLSDTKVNQHSGQPMAHWS